MGRSLNRVLAILASEFAVLRQDAVTFVILLAMPLATIPFVRGAYRDTLTLHRAPGANGSEQAVPGMTILFGFFLVVTVGLAFFRDHGWGMWDRLRTSARPMEIIAAKLIPFFLVAAIQQGILFSLGALWFGLNVSGSILGLVALSLACAFCIVALGLALVSLCKTMNQLTVLGNVMVIALAGVGGVITPISTLPGWAHSIAPAVPTYWAMRGFRSVILERGGLGAAALPVAVLLGVGVAAVVVARFRFRMADQKVGWA